MGKTRIVVNSTASNLISDTPNVLNQSIIASIMGGTNDIAGDLQKTVRNSLKFKFNSLHKYGSRKYFYGLPKGEQVLSGSADPTQRENIELAIESEVGEGVEVRGANLSQDSASDFMNYVLQEEDIEHNNGVIVDPVRDMPEIPIGGSPDDVTVTAKNAVFNGDGTYTIWYTWQHVGAPYEQSRAIVYTGYELYAGEPYWIAYYDTDADIAANGGTTDGLKAVIWVYRINSNVYPIGDIDEELGNPYYPSVPVRYFNADQTAPELHESDKYITSKKLLSKVGLDFDELGKMIHGDPDLEAPTEDMQTLVVSNHPQGTPFLLHDVETVAPYDVVTTPASFPSGILVIDYNDADYQEQYDAWLKGQQKIAPEHEKYEANQGKLEDVDDIDHAFVTFGVTVLSTKPESLDYLFQFWRWQSFNSYYTKQDYDDYIADPPEGYPMPWQNSIDLNTANGTYRIKIPYNYSHLETVTGSIGEVGTVLRSINILPQGPGGSSFFDTIGFFDERSELILKKQISETEYEQVTVKGIHHINYVYSSTGFVVLTLEDVQNNADLEPSFIIPLHKFAMRNMPLRDEIALCYDACKMVIQTIEVVRLKWYQNPSIIKLFQAVALALAVFTAGNSLYLLYLGEITISQIATQIAIAAIISEGVQFVAEQFGLEFAIALAIATAAFTFGAKLSGTLANLAKSLPFAEHLLTISNAALSGAQKSVDNAMQELMTDYNQLMDELQADMDELKQLQEQYDQGLDINPLWYTDYSTSLFFGESSDQYLNRMAHPGNVGIKSIEAVTHYVDNKLRLPEITETILGV